MTPSRSFLFRKMFGLLVFGCTLIVHTASNAKADAPTGPGSSLPTKTTSPADDALQYLQIVRAKNACKTALDLKVENAAVKDVAARVQKKLLTSPDPFTAALYVEVRNVRPIILSFAAKDSTVGGVLGAVAKLSGSQLWLFTDHLLLAPEDALTPAERASLKESWETFLKSSIDANPFWQKVQQRFIAFIYADIRSHPNEFELRGQIAPHPENDMSIETKLAFSQLSPDSQMMLSQLIKNNNDGFPIPVIYKGAEDLIGPLIISSNSITTIKWQFGTLYLEVPLKEKLSLNSMQWGASGLMTYGALPSRPSTPPVVIDPSAGKS